MNATMLFAENLLGREYVSKEDKAALKQMVVALSEEEKKEVEAKVAEVEAKTEKVEAETEEAKQLSETKTKLAEMEVKLAEAAAKEEAAAVKSFTAGLMLSEKNLTGFSADVAEKNGLEGFVASLSEEQRAKFSELMKGVKTVDEAMLSELGSGAKGEAANDEDMKLAEAKALADKYQAEGMKASEAVTKAQKEVLGV